MFVKLLTRSGLLSCLSSAAWFSVAVEVPEAPLNNSKKFNTSGQTAPSTLTNVEDVEIFSKLKGCRFIFLDKSQKKGYEGTTFVESILKEKRPKTNKKHWEGQVWGGADYIKNYSCKNGKILTYYEKYPSLHKYSLKTHF